MKKFICILLLFVFCICSNAQEYDFVKMQTFDNSADKGLYRRNADQIGDDDMSGNYISADEDGTLYIECIDGNRLVKILSDGTLETVSDLSFLNQDFYATLTKVKDKTFVFSDEQYRIQLVNEDYKTIFKINLSDLGIETPAKNFYYDFDNNVVFYVNQKKELCSIIAPEIDVKHNKNKCHDNEQTKNDILNGNYRGITYSSNDSIFLNNQKIKIGHIIINGIDYHILRNVRATIKANESSNMIDFADESNNEICESACIHPSGDIYVLRYNENTRVHTLYRIQNTWDPIWRNEWYSVHK